MKLDVWKTTRVSTRVHPSPRDLLVTLRPPPSLECGRRTRVGRCVRDHSSGLGSCLLVRSLRRQGVVLYLKGYCPRRVNSGPTRSLRGRSFTKRMVGLTTFVNAKSDRSRRRITHVRDGPPVSSPTTSLGDDCSLRTHGTDGHPSSVPGRWGGVCPSPVVT